MQQSPHPSTAFQTSMSSFIYHILLSLADLSLIYGCRLHDQSICNRGTCVSTGHSIGQPTYQLHAPRWGNLSTSYTIDQSTYRLHTPRSGNLSISHVIGQSMS